MKKTQYVKVAVLVSAVFAGLVCAGEMRDAQSGFYVGVGLGSSDFKVDAGLLSQANRAVMTRRYDFSKQLFVGYRVLPLLDVELGYQSLGGFVARDVDGATVNATTDSYTASFIGHMPLNASSPWGVFGRAGMAHLRTTSILNEFSQTKNKPVLGAGVEYVVPGLFTVQGEYTRVAQYMSNSSVSVLGINLKYPL